MLKKGARLLAFVFCVATPHLANAWYVSATASRPAGDSTSRVSPAGSTYVASPSGFVNISTIAGSGFQVNRVTIDGLSLCSNPSSGGLPLCINAAYYPVVYAAGKTTRTLVAYFAPATIPGTSLTVVPDSHSSYKVISPINGTLTNITIGDSRIISIIPYLGYRIDTVTSPGCIQSASLVYAGARDVACTNIQSPITVTVNQTSISQTVTAYAGPDRTANGTGTSNAISLGGSAAYTIGPVSYAWSAVGANAGSAHFGSPTSAGTTFYADVPGTYTVQLVATAAGPTVSAPETAVITVENPVASREALCTSCHASRNPAAVSDYDTSKHKLAGVVCQTCHDPTNSGHYTVAAPVNSCTGCHPVSDGTIPLHPFMIAGNPCVSCHNSHSTAGSMYTPAGTAHYNNITSAGYPASFVTSRAACSNCHYTDPGNPTIRNEWAQSAHAAVTSPPWTVNDFKTMSGCVQCHTTTGFIAYSTGKVTAAWGVSSDKTKEVLTCIGCHSDITTGAIRKAAALQPFADDAYRNRDVGNSNICMNCHSGRNNGMSITARLNASANFNNLQFIAPHFLTGGGTLHGKSGYHFPGQTYAFYSSNTHRAIGIANIKGTGTSGPCITCHKDPTYGHTFMSGIVSVCANCHGSTFSLDRLKAAKADFANALEVLRIMLQDRGFVYTASSPYFNNTAWGTGQAGANTMGAAFNYMLLLREPGGYAHNSAYARKLAIDSIDSAYNNGTVTGSIDYALSYLQGKGLISQQTVDSLNRYRLSNSCSTCHGGTSGSATPIATNAHSTHLTGSYGPGSYLGSTTSSCQTCHVYNAVQPDPLHANGVVNLVTGACAGCHPGTVPTWTASTRLACTVCHAAVPSILPNGVAAPYKPRFATAGHGQFAASNQCTVCHDQNSAHISGSLGVNMRLFFANDNSQCASCHNNATARVMSTHVLDKNATPTPSLCKTCHDVHGTTNLHMIRTVINGTAITFTNMSTGFVKTAAPYNGLCQVCHTLTSHYRSGVAETGHPTKNCLSCHDHKGSFAFQPAGNCDSCHGYPPAPVGFKGTQGNYSSARVQDYPNGGGAHVVAGHIKKGARPSEGWANCAGCHSNGFLNPATHLMTPSPPQQINITIDPDDDFKFNSFHSLNRTKYSGPLDGSGTTGKCSNTSCHLGPSPVWK